MAYQYDVFISYRRDGGEYTAKILHDYLSKLGYRVFFDVESLRSGQFNTKLFTVIDECRDVITVLSPNSLDRCVNKDDWVRQELAYALQKNRNVIPVLLRGFRFPDQLPEDIEPLRYQNGMEASSEFFDAFVKKLVKFLQSKPKVLHKGKRKLILAGIIASSILLLILAGMLYKEYKEEEITAKDTIHYLSTNLEHYNTVLSEFAVTISALSGYNDNLDNDGTISLLITLASSKVRILEQKESYTVPDDELLSSLAHYDPAGDDIDTLMDFVKRSTDDILFQIDYVKSSLSDSSITEESILNLVEYYQRLLEADKDLTFYYLNNVSSGVDNNAWKNIKYSLLPSLTYINNGQKWYEEREAVQEVTNDDISIYQYTVDDITKITGSQETVAENTENAEMNLQEAQAELNTLKTELEDIRAEAKEKFKPLETDDISILWGKMLRFNTLKMYDMCIECLEMFHKKEDTEEAAIYVPIAEEFFRQIDVTGINYGCLVCGYEPDKPHNRFYQLGDILIEMNGKKISTADDIEAAKIYGQDNQVKVLRYNGEQFEVIDGVIPSGDSLVMLYDMCEVMDE